VRNAPLVASTLITRLSNVANKNKNRDQNAARLAKTPCST